MLCDANKCTACEACITVCPNNCIKFEYSSDGYSQPVVDEARCTHCGLCEKACPVLNPFKKQSVIFPEVYCAKSKDSGLLNNSASGGLATEISRFFINERNGYACGVKNEGDHIPQFFLMDDNSDYRLISGSRYVHSRANGIYKKVKESLNSGKEVFFCGLPCQVAALYSFLKKDYEKLFTADIVCHGCSEEKVYKDYLDFIQDEKGEKIVKVSHTSKDNGWSILIQKLMKFEFESGDIIYRWSQQDPYLSLFLDCSIFRPACYSCNFARFPRTGDITLGDFFGIGTIKKAKNIDKNGVSMVMINTVKGKYLFNMMQPYLWAEKRDIKEAVYYNLNLWKPSNKSRIHNDLEKDIQVIGWDQISKKYYFSAANKAERILRKAIKTVIGDKNTARLMLCLYKANGITQKADKALNELQQYIADTTEKQ